METTMEKEHEVERIMKMVEEYSRHLVEVDFWSGKQKNGPKLEAAYESRKRLQKELSGLITY